MQKSKTFDFEELIINFNYIKKAVHKSFNKILLKDELNPMHIMHIMTLYKNKKPLFLTDLIDIINVDKATTTRVINDLIDRGYVEKTTANIRKFKICLNKKGIKIAKYFYEERKFIFKKILFEFNEEDKENLYILLEKIKKGIEREDI